MKVKVCKKCSKLDIDKLEDLSEKYSFKLKKICLGHCKEKKKDYFFGKIKSKFIKVKNQDEFFKKLIKKAKKAQAKKDKSKAKKEK